MGGSSYNRIAAWPTSAQPIQRDGTEKVMQLPMNILLRRIVPALLLVLVLLSSCTLPDWGRSPPADLAAQRCAPVEAVAPESPQGQHMLNALLRVLGDYVARDSRERAHLAVDEVWSIIQQDGWALVQTSFHEGTGLEPGAFVLRDTNEGYAYDGVVWGGMAESAEDIRDYLAVRADDAPELLFACAEFAPWFVAQEVALPAQHAAADSEEQRARAALQNYLAAMYAGRYDEAAQFYGGPYDTLRAQNPFIAEDDTAALLEAACTQNGYLCLPIYSIEEGRARTTGMFEFLVTFEATDGGTFVFSPPPGSPGVPLSQFPFTVIRNGGSFLVHGLPPYVS
jgi:hypothetical protein